MSKIEKQEIKIPPSECCKGKSPGLGTCCCNCKHHLRDFSHPWTNGHSILIQRGWACYPPGFYGVQSGWTEHGKCELWEQAPEPVEDNNEDSY